MAVSVRLKALSKKENGRMVRDGEDSGASTPAAQAAADKENPEMNGKTCFLCHRKDVRGWECGSRAPDAVRAGMLP